MFHKFNHFVNIFKYIILYFYGLYQALVGLLISKMETVLRNPNENPGFNFQERVEMRIMSWSKHTLLSTDETRTTWILYKWVTILHSVFKNNDEVKNFSLSVSPFLNAFLPFF